MALDQATEAADGGRQVAGGPGGRGPGGGPGGGSGAVSGVGVSKPESNAGGRPPGGGPMNPMPFPPPAQICKVNPPLCIASPALPHPPT